MANKIALVTGSTSGIGKPIARDLAYQGYRLILNSHASIDPDFITTEFPDHDNVHFFVKKKNF